MIHHFWRVLPAFILGFVVFTSVACGQARKNIDITEAKAMIDKGGVVVLDVRTLDEWNGGHLKNAVHANVNDASFNQKIASIDKKTTVVVYCAVGGRSARASDMMMQQGWKNVYNMTGGISAWSAARLPTTTK